MTADGSRYDVIGTGYGQHRRPDPRIAAAIDAALAGAATVADVGSGAGSYQPRGRAVVAVEPSQVMIDQRPPGAAPVVQAVAEHLPFADGVFDAGLAVLTMHHWRDPPAGLRELARVAKRQVVLTFDPELTNQYWLITEYLPGLAAGVPKWAGPGAVNAALSVVDIVAVPVPWDCQDGLMRAYWRRPERYLDAGARRAISGFHRLDPPVIAEAMARLAKDISSGRWARRHRDLLARDTLDFGLRLVIGEGLRSGPDQ